MLKGKRILLVEDEALVAMHLEDIVMELEAIVVGPEGRLADAIACAEQADIDAAILDLNLHGQRSYGVADVLVRRGVPFAFATGYGEAGLDPAHSNALVLVKPYNSNDVAQALQQLLGPAHR